MSITIAFLYSLVYPSKDIICVTTGGNRMRIYTSQEARTLLGDISSSKLKKYVDSGKIRRYVRPGNKLGVYDASDTDTLVREIKEFDSKFLRKDAQHGRTINSA